MSIQYIMYKQNNCAIIYFHIIIIHQIMNVSIKTGNIILIITKFELEVGVK